MDSTAQRKVIPLNVVRGDSLNDVEALHERLEASGYMRLMQVSEPRLSELVARYLGKGYEVEVLPLLDESDLAVAPPAASGGGCGPGACASAGSCSSGGGCSTKPPAGGTSSRHAVPRQAVPGVGTIYVRLSRS